MSGLRGRAGARSLEAVSLIQELYGSRRSTAGVEENDVRQKMMMHPIQTAER